MNTKHKYGNVIRNSIATEKASFEFPKELPTEEWDANEIRNYDNYIRPIENLFGNDREIISGLTHLYFGLSDDISNHIIHGCGLIVTEFSSKYYTEVSPGLFMNSGKLYNLYPRCEVCAKQIESVLNGTGTYSDDYHVFLTCSLEYSSGNSAQIQYIYSGYIKFKNEVIVKVEESEKITSAALLLLTLNKKMLENNYPEFITYSSTVENYIILPIFENNSIIDKLYFTPNSFKVAIDDYDRTTNRYTQFDLG